MKARLFDTLRSSRSAPFIGGTFLGILLDKLFEDRRIDWPLQIDGMIVGILTVWGIQRLWVWRKRRDNAGEMKIVAAIVVVGVCQIVFSVHRGNQPRSIEDGIAAIIMVGLAGLLLWKWLNPTAT